MNMLVIVVLIANTQHVSEQFERHESCRAVQTGDQTRHHHVDRRPAIGWKRRVDLRLPERRSPLSVQIFRWTLIRFSTVSIIAATGATARRF